MKVNQEQNLFDKIMNANNRLRMLKLQGESSNNKTLKSIRKRRNDNVKRLVKLFQEETNYYDLNKRSKGE